MSSSSSSSSSDMEYDVFISFRGEDIRKTFLSHLMSELDNRYITAFKDDEMETSRPLGPELKQAIRNSRIAVVIFSENYASSSWCLDELLEIVKCKEEFGQKVIPVFYSLDPTHVRKQTGKFGDVFKKTCETKTKTEEQKTRQWGRALTDVANLVGYHSGNWCNEAKMLEKVAADVWGKVYGKTSGDELAEEMSDLLKFGSKMVLVTSFDVLDLGLGLLDIF